MTANAEVTVPARRPVRRPAAPSSDTRVLIAVATRQLGRSIWTAGFSGLAAARTEDHAVVPKTDSVTRNGRTWSGNDIDVMHVKVAELWSVFPDLYAYHELLSS
jgi:hypothetical protein